jgi:hypothetical protein
MTSASATQFTYNLEPEEKVTSVIAYTQTGLFWGDVITKEQIRVSTWLKTVAAPDRVQMHNARLIHVIPSGKPAPIHFPEVYIPTADILIFHMVPPQTDPLDYDPSEPNRKMEPIVALVNNFRLDATIRIAQITNLGKYLDVVKEPFTSMYNVDITCPIMPSLGCMKVPYAMVRQQPAIFASRS